MYLFASDGSGGNTKIAGYGLVIYNTENGKKTCKSGKIMNYKVSDARIEKGEMILEYIDEQTKASNNRGELCGILFAILVAKVLNLEEITIITDSTYCINTLKTGGWYENWERTNIVDKKANPDLIRLIVAKKQGININFIHQRSHLKANEVAKLKTETEILYYKLNALADDLAGK